MDLVCCDELVRGRCGGRRVRLAVLVERRDVLAENPSLRIDLLNGESSALLVSRAKGAQTARFVEDCPKPELLHLGGRRQVSSEHQREQDDDDYDDHRHSDPQTPSLRGGLRRLTGRRLLLLHFNPTRESSEGSYNF